MSNMNPALEEIRLSEIVFDEGLYPRVDGHDPATVQTYARDLELIEAAGKFISVNAAGVLLDGRHRMLAYKTRADGQDPMVKVYRYQIESPLESFRLACSLQDKGRALSNEDRVTSAKRLYALGDHNQEEIGAALGVHRATIAKWLSRTLKEEKDRKASKALDMWFAYNKQEDIADACGVTQPTIHNWEEGFINMCHEHNFIKSTDFDIPIYNVWKQQNKSNSVDHFGNSEPRWLDNLLYLYTEPADVVVDPFGGSASTVDVCKKRGRRYFVSDRKPIPAREGKIRQHDLMDGLPNLHRWEDVRLVYLDPPYWKQAEGQYSDDPTDLANMDLDTFNKTLSKIIKDFAAKINNAYIALIIQPTQWKAPAREFTDHVGDMLRAVNLPVDMRFSVPYESQQCTAQMVEWAKANKRCLVLTREIIVWRVVS